MRKHEKGLGGKAQGRRNAQVLDTEVLFWFIVLFFFYFLNMNMQHIKELKSPAVILIDQHTVQ